MCCQGNYTEYVRNKAEKEALQWAAWEKQQKEVDKLKDIIQRLSGGAQSGRAAGMAWLRGCWRGRVGDVV